MNLGETRFDGLNVFISGPVTGFDRETTVARFASAAIKCKQLGAKSVFNPVETVPQGASHEDAMRRCLNELTMEDFETHEGFYDVLVQLNGWSYSRGAVAESDVATACGIRRCGEWELR